MTDNLNAVFFALSDPTRRGILSQLARGKTTIGELSRPFPISAPAISKHMKILEKAGLIDRQVEGRQHVCSLSSDALQTAEDWINFHREFWECRLDALDDFLTKKEPTKEEK